MDKKQEIRIGDYVSSTLESIENGRPFVEGYVKSIEFNIATVRVSGYPSKRCNLEYLKKDDEYIDQLLREA